MICGGCCEPGQKFHESKLHPGKTTHKNEILESNCNEKACWTPNQCQTLSVLCGGCCKPGGKFFEAPQAPQAAQCNEQACWTPKLCQTLPLLCGGCCEPGPGQKFHEGPQAPQCNEQNCWTPKQCRTLPDICGGCCDPGQKFDQHEQEEELIIAEKTVTTSSLSREEIVQIRDAEAQARISLAIRKINTHQTEESMKRWFGNRAYTDTGTRAEIQRILNSVSSLLTNVEYRFPGEKQVCGRSTYAYVDSRDERAKNDQGQFIVYLCNLFFESDEGVQVEVLTHEASHHAVSYTQDVCVDELYDQNAKPNYVHIPREIFVKHRILTHGDKALYPGRKELVQITESERGLARIRQVTSDTVTLEVISFKKCKRMAYGRKTCAKLAEVNPLNALVNADNFCYYVQDIKKD